MVVPDDARWALASIVRGLTVFGALVACLAGSEPLQGQMARLAAPEPYPDNFSKRLESPGAVEGSTSTIRLGPPRVEGVPQTSSVAFPVRSPVTDWRSRGDAGLPLVDRLPQRAATTEGWAFSPAEKATSDPLRELPSHTTADRTDITTAESTSNRQALPLTAEQLTAALPALTQRSVYAQVQQHVRRGSRLAERGAYYSARREFAAALRLVAETRDQVHPRVEHRQALEEAFTAWQEAEDFQHLMADGSGDSSEQVNALVAVHTTPVLKERRGKIKPSEALQLYFAYAQERLASALAGDRLAAEALFGLGRVYALLAEQPSQVERLALPKALTLYRTAVWLDPSYAAAANELAVLLARYGQYVHAKQVLQAVPMERRSAEMWHNLAVIHEHLGELQWAEEARRHQLAASQLRQAHQPLVAQEGNVRWYDVTAWVDVPSKSDENRTAWHAQFTDGGLRR